MTLLLAGDSRKDDSAGDSRDSRKDDDVLAEVSCENQVMTMTMLQNSAIAWHIKKDNSGDDTAAGRL